MYVRRCVCNSLFYVCVDITVRFNQSAYNVTGNSKILLQLFLVLSIPSTFNETAQLVIAIIGSGMIGYPICNVCMSITFQE